jgi:hypothetical protein
MKIVIFFAPAFMGFGKAFMKEIQKREPKAEFIGIALTRRTYLDLKKDKTCKFKILECLETREREWLNGRYNPEELKSFESEFGPKVINDILILDRHVGAGMITGAVPMDTALSRAARDHYVMRAYMTNMIRYFVNLYDEEKPDAVFLYVVAGAPMGAAAWIAKAKDIPDYYLLHTRVDDRYVIDTSIKGHLDPIWSRFFDGARPRPEFYAMAESWLDEFRARDKKPDYYSHNQTEIMRRFSIFKTFKDMGIAAMRAVYYGVFPDQKQLRAENGFYKISRTLSTALRAPKMAGAKLYDDYDALKDREFIYFPLHVDPEASTMHLAPDFTNQAAVIEALAKRRPLHLNILVKEHPYMVGLRPQGLYDAIRRLPGVYLINPAVASQDMIKRCKMVFTITGTVAWEAIALKKPVAMLGDFPFTPFATEVGRGVKLAGFDTLADDILEALSMPAVEDEELLRFLGLLYEESFSLSSAFFWGKTNPEIVRQNIHSVENMAEHFLSRVAESDQFSRAA